jgi:hypothetical protein
MCMYVCECVSVCLCVCMRAACVYVYAYSHEYVTMLKAKRDSLWHMLVCLWDGGGNA